MAKNPQNVVEGEVDEGLYSRQLYVFGYAAMRRMQSSTVLISGMKGLGVEIAKNIVLGGVKSVTVHDSANASWSDLSAQFCLREDDIGKNRAEVTLPRLAELNSYVRCSCYTGKLSEEYLENFQIVVLTDSSMEEQLTVGEFCHTNDIKFIVAETRGLAGMVFCDFGEEFVVHSVDGELPAIVMVADIDEAGVVTCCDGTRHGYEDGDYVQFTEVMGMTELNSHEPFKIKCIGPTKFSIGSVEGFTPYKQGGIVTRVKMPQTRHFKSIKEAVNRPEFVITDIAKSDRPPYLHIAFQALHEYAKRKAELPRNRNKDDAAEFLTIFNEVNANSGAKCDDVDENLIKEFAFGARGDLCPLAAVVGGITAQEVMKSCTGTFNPLFQYLYFDAVECLPQDNRDEELTEQTFSQKNNRYDGQTAVFGQDFQNKLGSLKYILVGAGAIGCELLKNWALMGLACGDNGRVYVSDNSIVKRSDLNRNFLFRPLDISSHKKSPASAAAVKVINPSFQVTAQGNKLDENTENIYTEDFFEQLDGVISAVNNENARVYINNKCVYYRKPLLDTRTVGANANIKVIIPYMTESYASSHDSPEKVVPMSVPIGTLKKFPFTTVHTIEWARLIFDEKFTEQIKTAKLYLTDATFMDKTSKQNDSHSIQTLVTVRKVLVDNRPLNFEDCVEYGRALWERYFCNQIQHILSVFPADQVTTSGNLFWSDNRRCPHPVRFDCNNDVHIDFVMSVANTRADIYGIGQERDRTVIKAMVEKLVEPYRYLKPKSEKQTTVCHPADQNTTERFYADELQNVKDQLPSPDSLKGFVLRPVAFETDDDTNFHMDFIVACSNMRAENYDIRPADRHQCKLVAGRIKPSIITTTAMVAGLACLEMIKKVQGHKELKLYKNSTCNLACPSFNLSEPTQVIKNKYYDTQFTLWDSFEIQGEMTLQEFLEYFQNEHRLQITILVYGTTLLYTFFLTKAKLKERLGLSMSEVVRRVTKKEIPGHMKCLYFEIMCDDLKGEEIEEVPFIRYILPRSQVADK